MKILSETVEMTDGDDVKAESKADLFHEARAF